MNAQWRLGQNCWPFERRPAKLANKSLNRSGGWTRTLQMKVAGRRQVSSVVMQQGARSKRCAEKLLGHHPSFSPSVILLPVAVSANYPSVATSSPIRSLVLRPILSVLPLMARSRFHRSLCARSGAHKNHRIEASSRFNAKQPVERQLCRRKNNHLSSTRHSTTETSNGTIHDVLGRRCAVGCADKKRCAVGNS